MRFLISKLDKIRLLKHLKTKNKCNSLKKLSVCLGIKYKTLNNLFYTKERYLPESLISSELDIKIIDKKQENWGRIKGGKKTYEVIKRKYGLDEIKKRQKNGGYASCKKRKEKLKKEFHININSPSFLEFYGALLGDGWLSSLQYNYKQKKNLWWVGLSGDLRFDKDYFLYLGKIINTLFNRKYILKTRKRNSIEIIFSHKELILFLNKDLNFPIGKKKKLEISNKISNKWNKQKHIIRGIFDTDGSFYLDKTSVGKDYPCISIEMKQKRLIIQLRNILKRKGFSVVYRETKKGTTRITLKGTKQLNKWRDLIGSSNKRHLKKINALVAQQDSAMPS